MSTVEKVQRAMRLREVNNLTIADACKKVGISTPTFYKFRNDLTLQNNTQEVVATQSTAQYTENMRLREENRTLRNIVLDMTLEQYKDRIV